MAAAGFLVGFAAADVAAVVVVEGAVADVAGAVVLALSMRIVSRDGADSSATVVLLVDVVVGATDADVLLVAGRADAGRLVTGLLVAGFLVGRRFVTVDFCVVVTDVLLGSTVVVVVVVEVVVVVVGVGLVSVVVEVVGVARVVGSSS